MKIVVIEKAVELADGRRALVRTPFERLPDWAQELVLAEKQSSVKE